MSEFIFIKEFSVELML